MVLFLNLKIIFFNQNIENVFLWLRDIACVVVMLPVGLPGDCK